ncbi:MAG: hypothetical protein RR365_15390 [Bacteroides sp.]
MGHVLNARDRTTSKPLPATLIAYEPPSKPGAGRLGELPEPVLLTPLAGAFIHLRLLANDRTSGLEEPEFQPITNSNLTT